MEVNDLRVEMYNKVAEIGALSKPQLLSELCILEKKDYFKNIYCFDVVDSNSHRFQLYVSKAPSRNVLKQIIFLKQSPKMLYLRGDIETLVIEQKIQDRLSDYLIFHDEKQSPFLQENYSRNIMMELIESLEDFLSHKLIYDCISPKNIVKVNSKWQFSAVGLIFNVDQKISDYYHPQIKDPQNSITFSLGALLFKMVFGFPFYDDQKPLPKLPVSFASYEPYLQYLQTLQKQKHLKIYFFIQRFISVSPLCLRLLQESLSGKLTLNDWKCHDYFTTPFKYKSSIDDRNKELLMINSVNQKKMSTMLAAIQFKKKYPLQRLNNKPLADPQNLSYGQIIENYRKNYLLRNLTFAPQFQKKQLADDKQQNDGLGPNFIGQYFYEYNFDPEEDYPCRQLLKFIEKDKEDHSDYYRNQQMSETRQAQLKMYAYPYAIAFQLLKVQKQQPIKIQRKIKQSIELLLQLSSFYLPKNVKYLHSTKSERYQDFGDMKGIYRQNINDLYRYFLTEAMRKYNVKKDNISIIERIKKKQKGLDYYRLCLKLLEVSLIVRKGGRDLNLARIETGQRKQIETDLEQLLKNYFPTKAEI